jgi:hypothetical protein
MKKILKYKISPNETIVDEASINWIYYEKIMGWSEANEEIAQREAYNGQYTIEEVPTSPAEEIAELKAKLAATDYQAIKYAEGVLSADEYEPTKIMRQEWRDRINELEVDA